jgi:hypothetical protein
MALRPSSDDEVCPATLLRRLPWAKRHNERHNYSWTIKQPRNGVVALAQCRQGLSEAALHV